jgi:manganese transport protein
LAAAIGQSKENSEFILIHIVESASAILLGDQTADYETQKDKERLEFYVNELKQKGFNAKGILGFRTVPKKL